MVAWVKEFLHRGQAGLNKGQKKRVESKGLAIGGSFSQSILPSYGLSLYRNEFQTVCLI